MGSTERPKRGEIWLTAFGAARSGEPGKTRPAVVVTPNQLIGDSQREMIAVVPLSSSVSASSLRPKVSKRSGIDAESLAIPAAVRGTTRRRLQRRIGKVSRAELRAIEVALGYCLGLAEL